MFVVLNNYMSCDMLLKPYIHGVCKSCYKFIQREGWNLLPQPPKRKEEKYFVLSKENLYNVMCTCAVCGFVLVDDAYHCDNTTHVLLEGNNHKQYLIVASIPESSRDPTLEEGKGLMIYSSALSWFLQIQHSCYIVCKPNLANLNIAI